MSCEITPTIKDKQGTWIPSKLFVELNSNYGYDKAMELYKGIHADSFIDTFGDWINDAFNQPIEDGYTRLYRIEERNARPIYDPNGSWITSNEQIKNREKYFGRWFTNTRSNLDWYKNDREFNATNSVIKILDVKTSDLSKYKDFDGKLSRDVKTEFVLPTELASLAKQSLSDINEQGEPSFESVKSFYGLKSNDTFGSLAGFTIGKTKGQKQAVEELTALKKATSKIEADLNDLTRLDVKGNNATKIKELQKVLDDLLDQETLIPLLAFAEDQLGPMIAKLAILNTDDTKAYTYKELNDIIQRTRFFGAALSPEEFSTNNPDLVKRRDNLVGTIFNQEHKILKLIEAKIVDNAAQDFNPKLLGAMMDFLLKKINPTKETTGVERFVLDSSKAVDAINKLADYYSLSTENEINQELLNRTDTLTNAYNAIIKAGRKAEDVYEMMYEKSTNKKGEVYYTGKIINKYAAEYNRLLNLRNSIIKNKSKKARINYLEEWTKGMKLKTIDRTKYLQEEANQKTVLNATDFLAWQSVHDPEIYKGYYDLFVSGDRSNDVVNGMIAFDQTINDDRFSYFSFSPSENLVDPQWKLIQEDPLAKAFYDAYKSTTTKSQNDLPSRFINGKLIPSNYIYELKKSLFEEMASEPLTRLLTTKARLGFLSTITEDDNQENYVFRNPYTGQNEYGLFVRNQRNLPLDYKSKNLYNIAVTQAALALEFKHKAELEPLLLLFRELSKTKPVLNNKGIPIFKPDNNNVKMLEFRLNNTLYGKGKVTEGGKINVKVYQDEDLAEAKALEAQLEEKKANKQTAIDQGKSQGFINKIDKEITEINDKLFKLGNMVSYRQMADTITDYTRIKGLAGNLVSASTDVIFGFVSLSTEGTRFGINPLAAARAYTIAQTSLVTRTVKGEDKVKRFAKLFDVESKLNEYKFNSKVAGKKNVIDKVITSDNFFLLQTISGKINAYATMIAVLRSNKVPGTNVSIYDAFDKNGDWKLDIANPYEIQYDEEGNFIPNKDVTKMSLLINDITASIHGNYDTKKPIEGKKEWYGRAAFIFKSWLPNSLQNRIGRQQIDLLSGREVKGRYRSIFNKGGFFRAENGKFMLGRMWKNSLSLVGYGTGEMNELDTNNMKVNLYEAIAAAFMGMVALMLSHLSGDDDDDDSTLLTYLINQNNRVIKDLSFYYNPFAAKKMLDINTLVPIMGTMEDFGNIFYLTARTLFDKGYDPIIHRGQDKNKHRLLTEATDAIPGWFGVKRTVNFVTTVPKSKKKRS